MNRRAKRREGKSKHNKESPKKSMAGVLIDMSDETFQTLLDVSNMTALLNIKTTLNVIYNNIAQVKDDIIKGILDTGTVDLEEGRESVHSFHTLLLGIERRYNDVCALIEQRNSEVARNIQDAALMTDNIPSAIL